MGQSSTSAGRLRLRGPGAGIALGIAAVALSAGLAACGGGQRQDATVPSGNYPVQITQAKFANHQKLSAATYLQLGIRNVGDKTIPNLAVTINTVEQGQPNLKSPAYSTGSGQGSFNVRIDDPRLSFPFRPVWILEEHYPTVIKPGQSIKGQLAKTPTSSAASAATDTFQFGEVKPNDSKDIAWRVTPVRTGTFTVRYEVSASLTGGARAVTPDGGPVKGEFVATISGKPPQTCVTGSGQVTTNCGP